MAEIKILLLRGVNVGGANRLPMPEFREMLTGLGLSKVETHIQSGNAVFLDPGVADLPGRIGAMMKTLFGFSPALFILTLAQYEAVLRANPYAAAGREDGSKVHLYFLAGPEKGFDLGGVMALAQGGEALHLTDACLYMNSPNGVGRSALAEKLPKYLKGAHTARNQRSAESILALARSIA